MKLGLVRHFKVNIKPGEGKLSPSQFEEAMKNYDYADVTSNGLIINKKNGIFVTRVHCRALLKQSKQFTAEKLLQPIFSAKFRFFLSQKEI